jgi:hypothetical protein
VCPPAAVDVCHVCSHATDTTISVDIYWRVRLAWQSWGGWSLGLCDADTVLACSLSRKHWQAQSA